ncbi:hypothetical protein C8T65DRAFT_651144 [Cerioporus squamosus]|nr:hypothetical protein C8T65DRAFT_651144 [Cerioporus squamosus]
MYPKAVDINGTYYLRWMGLLADWEMSKPLPGKQPGGKRHRRQPERTGTWQYMSVALLSRDKNVEISDELEAFFYVLLYHVVRYLRSNIDDYAVANYLDEFFDQYTYIDQGYRCGSRKLQTMHVGKLMVTGDVELTFDKTMNDLVTTLLLWFQSNYIVSKHLRQLEEEKRQQKQQLYQAQMPPPPLPLLSHSTRPGPVKASLVFVEDEDEDVAEDASIPPPPKTEPTTQQWEDSKKVQKNTFVYRLLDRYLRQRKWPANDKLGDRIPQSWVRAPLGSTVLPATKSSTRNKRARIGPVDGVATVPIPQHLQPPMTPLKRQESTPDKWWRSDQERTCAKGDSLPL